INSESELDEVTMAVNSAPLTLGAKTLLNLKISLASSLAFLDVGPLTEGHALVIPKYHAQFLHELPDAEMVDLLPTAKKVAQAIGCKNYNVLQNNGRLAHQAVDHVHFHVIPKPHDNEGLVIEWNTKTVAADRMEEIHKSFREKLEKL
ncbi:hypothetical protein BGZ46_005021, partial [Entomortierella lignicola]